MKKILLSSLFLVVAPFINAEELSLEKVKEISSKATSQLNSELKKGLKKAKRSGSSEAMADYCINDSMKVVEKINKELGEKVHIKRVSLDNRNEKSKALEGEINILKAFDLMQKSNAYLPKQIVQIVDDNTYKVYSPIKMKSRECKKCHGTEKKVDKKLKKRFFEVYKNNNAYGYKSGDVRGAVVVTISK